MATGEEAMSRRRDYWLAPFRDWYLIYQEMHPYGMLFRPDRIATLILVLAMLAVVEGVRWLLT